MLPNRMRSWAMIAGAVAVCGYLGYRVVSLERRLDAVAARLGAAGGSARAAAAGSPDGHEQRLSWLERDVRALRDDLSTLEEATGKETAVAAQAQEGGEQRILSVVERQQKRIRDKQLEFHRSRWLEWRQSALEEFAEKHGLTPWQVEQVQRLLTAEVDSLAEILRRPDVLENPEGASEDWLAVLEATDTAARRLLNPTQIPAWDVARTVERRVLWPWLPVH
jgi:hypothetical protein